MGEDRKKVRWLRVTGALLLGVLLLAALLPSTGGIIAGSAPNPEMRRWGPFLVFPSAFFGVIATITILTTCTVFGILRRNNCEFIGWALFGLVVFVMIFA